MIACVTYGKIWSLNEYVQLKTVSIHYCSLAFLRKRRNRQFVIFFNDCNRKHCHVHMLNNEYNHHVYTKVLTLAYLFFPLGDQVFYLRFVAIPTTYRFVNSAIFRHSIDYIYMLCTSCDFVQVITCTKILYKLELVRHKNTS